MAYHKCSENHLKVYKTFCGKVFQKIFTEMVLVWYSNDDYVKFRKLEFSDKFILAYAIT